MSGVEDKYLPSEKRGNSTSRTNESENVHGSLEVQHGSRLRSGTRERCRGISNLERILALFGNCEHC